MAIKLSDLPIYLRYTEVYFIGRGNPDILLSMKPALIDGKVNSTGNDIALLFSTSDKAFAYRDRFRSLQGLDVFQASVQELMVIFSGLVDCFIVDNPPT